jgi:hypothetical protein
MFVLGVMLAWFDVLFIGFVNRARCSVPAMLKLMTGVILIAGIFDYVWVGTFTFTSRNLLRVALLYLCASIVLLLKHLMSSARRDGRKAGRLSRLAQFPNQD